MSNIFMNSSRGFVLFFTVACCTYLIITTKNNECTQRRVAGMHVCIAYFEKYLDQGH